MLEELINNVDSIILSFVQGSFTSLTPIISTLWRLMFIIFIAFFGYKVILSGKFSAPSLVLNCVKIIVLLVLATQWDNFLIVVYNMTTDLPSDIAGVMISNVNSVFAAPLPQMNLLLIQLYLVFMIDQCSFQKKCWKAQDGEILGSISMLD